MARLLDLPDELIFAITDYLQADTTQTILPFHEWGEGYHRVIEHNPSQRIKNLRSLHLASRRLNGLLKPTFYRDICVRQKTFGNNPLDQLEWTLANDPSLEEHIISAIVPCDDSIIDVYRFFWFANIQTLSILRFKDWEPVEFENDSYIGTSPVKTLNLIACGAHEEALAAVLSWPAALEVLHVDADQGEWDGHYENEPENTWTCAAFVRALQSQKATLKELTLTRPRLEHEGLGNGPRIDLSDFTTLTTLRIYHVFLCGLDDPQHAWRGLPRNLEVLEVFYDDTDLTRFLEEGGDAEHDAFLLGLVRHKEKHLPHLHAVSIHSPELLYDRERDEWKPAGPWTPPSPLARKFETAGITLDVWLGYIDPPELGEVDIPQLLERPPKRRRLVQV